MNFNEHYNLKSQHAFLGASNYHWLNYSDGKIVESYQKMLAASRGTRLHAYACESIKLGIKLPKNNKTLNMYINDAIGYKMHPEQVLYYSDNCFGTADTISFSKNKFLRIHDLKTGESPASMLQLRIYAAIFCLEYHYNPNDIKIELRIYQQDSIEYDTPTIEDIAPIMDKIITFDKIIDKMKFELEE